MSEETPVEPEITLDFDEEGAVAAAAGAADSILPAARQQVADLEAHLALAHAEVARIEVVLAESRARLQAMGG